MLTSFFETVLLFICSFWKTRGFLAVITASSPRGLSLCLLAGLFPEILSYLPEVPLIKNQMHILFQCYLFDEVMQSTNPKATWSLTSPSLIAHQLSETSASPLYINLHVCTFLDCKLEVVCSGTPLHVREDPLLLRSYRAALMWLEASLKLVL